MKQKKWTPFQNSDVAEVYFNYSDPIKDKLLFLRELILDVAKESEEIGEIEEALRWNQPSFITSQSKSGSTIRIDKIKSNSENYAIFFHCQTNLISNFRKKYSKEFLFEGNRSIVFKKKDQIPVDALKDCIRQAFTYHLKKK